MRERIAILAAGLCLFAPCALFSQPAPASPTFDVASIKPNQMSKVGGRGSDRENVHTSPGSLSMRNSSLSSCIQWAYHVSQFQISGPAWLNSERFDIVAKAAEPAVDDQLKLMLQALLAERFKLAVHREEKVMAVYELVVGKSGHKMKESTSEGEVSFNGTPGKPVAAVQRVSMALVAEMLSKGLRAPVLDKTGLKGKFDFTVDLSSYVTKDMKEDDVPGIAFAALQEQLGLKLESKKSPVEMLVIDRVEKVPTEN